MQVASIYLQSPPEYATLQYTMCTTHMICLPVHTTVADVYDVPALINNGSTSYRCVNTNKNKNRRLPLTTFVCPATQYQNQQLPS